MATRTPETDKASPIARARGLLLLFSTASSILVLFIIIPLLILVTTAGLGGVEDALKEEALDSILLSLYASSLAATLAVLLGTPLSYLMSRLEFWGKSVLESVLDLPLILPHTVAGIAILLAFNSRSTLGSVFSGAGFRVEDSFWGIVLAMLFVSAPFAVNMARQGFSSIDPDLENVARSLGAGPLRVFVTISLPMAWRSILIGWLLAMARSLSEVGAILIVAYRPRVASVLVWEWFTTKGLGAAAGLSTVLLAVSLAMLAAMRALGVSGK